MMNLVEGVKSGDDGVSLLKRRHFWLAIIGLFLCLSPEVYQALQQNGFPWGEVKDVIKALGETAIIGAIIAYFLDVNLVRNVDSTLDLRAQELNTSLETKIDRINRDVFEGTLGKLVDEDLLSVFVKGVLHCPFYRTDLKLDLTLTLESIEINGKKSDYLRCEWHEKYLVHSLQSPSASHTLDIAISTDEVFGLNDRCGVTKVVVGGEVHTGSPFIGKDNNKGISRFKEVITVRANAPVTVESFSQAYKTLTDSETFELNLPSKNIELAVTVVGCNLTVRSNIMCAEPSSHGWRHGINGCSHWVCNGAMLPHQGISLSWSPTAPNS